MSKKKKKILGLDLFQFKKDLTTQKIMCNMQRTKTLVDSHNLTNPGTYQ